MCSFGMRWVVEALEEDLVEPEEAELYGWIDVDLEVFERENEEYEKYKEADEHV